MSNLEITRLCALAMGLHGYIPCTQGPFASDSMLTKRDGEQSVIYYDPLHNDAQAMALVKRFELEIFRSTGDGEWDVMSDRLDSAGSEITAQNTDLNRAICTCVARVGYAPPPRPANSLPCP